MRQSGPSRLLILTVTFADALMPRIHGWIRAARRFILLRKSPLCPDWSGLLKFYLDKNFMISEYTKSGAST